MSAYDWERLIPELQRLLDDAVLAGEECGCQLALYEHGVPVCDLYAGFCDAAHTRPAGPETLFPVFSTGKGVVATAIHRLVERGVLEYDLPIASVWPEFGCCGKEKVTLRHLLSHQSGLFRLPPGCGNRELGNWELMCRRILPLTPAWEPGSRCRYQPLTYAWLLGSVAEHVTRTPFPELLRSLVLSPLHLEEDLYFGLPETEERRCAALERGSMPAGEARWYLEFLETPEIRRGFLPSANGFGTARGLAKHYAALMDRVEGVRLLFPQTLAEAVRYQAPQRDDDPVRWAKFGLGYLLGGDGETPDGRLFGHAGAAGAEGFADRRTGLALGFANNRLAPSHPLQQRLADLLKLPLRLW